jgi:hypothetical protein
MAEQEKKPKKRGIVKRIFGWIWLGLLTSLILGALVYDAPWKVIVLLLIILAACTILPKPYRKWFWLSVAAVVVVLIIWVFLPDENGGWRPYTFEKELAALQAKYAVPDSENAALLYSKLFEGLDIDSNQPEFYTKSEVSSISGPWRGTDHPETAEWLKGHQRTIDTLMEISRIEKCRFSITANPADTERWEHLQKMRRCAFLLLSVANNDIAEGRTDAGLEKYLCLTRMANHLYQQPAIIDFLVGVAIEARALTHLNRFIMEGEPTEQQLQSIATSLPDLKNNWGLDFGKALEYEKLLAKNSFCCFFYQVNPRGDVRFSRKPFVPADAYFLKDAPVLSYWQRKRGKGAAVLGWFFMPSTPQEIAKAIDKSYGKYYAMAAPNFDWKRKPDGARLRFKLNYLLTIKLLTGMSESTYYRFHEIYLKSLAFRRGSRLLVAIKQYKNENGGWPPDLNAIKSRVLAEAFIDPVSGSQFEYERHDSRFSLYGAAGNIWPK